MRRRSLVLVSGVVAAGAVGGLGVGIRRHATAQTPDWTSAELNGLYYEVLLPNGYDPARKYPVVLYLHQLDMGNYRAGLRKQVNRWFATDAFRTRYQCIVVVPMLDQTQDPGGRTVNFGGKREGHAGEDNSIAILKQVIERYAVAAERVYVTGNSMGGMGTWDMLLRYNALTGDKGLIFAGGLPVAGAHRTADPAQAAQTLRNVPIWAIHGARDHEVSLDWDRSMARLLAGSPTFRYTEVPDAGHDVWDETYVRQDVWDWLFAQSHPV